MSENLSIEHKRSIFDKYITEAKENNPHWNDDQLHQDAVLWSQRYGVKPGEFTLPWAPIEPSPPNPIPYALLTGAGFSKDWGGFLVHEMTARILSSRILDEEPDIRLSLLTSSYESLLETYRKKTVEVSSEQAIYQRKERYLTRAIREAYDFQDRIQTRNSVDSPSLASLMRLIISPAMSKPFSFFTLNHDLLVERKWPQQQTGAILDSPGIQRIEAGDAPRTRRITQFDKADFGHTGRCKYVKLHGSVNWVEDVDGIETMAIVAGGGKEQMIRNGTTPAWHLINSYYEFFRLSVGTGTTILIIGYSFADEHVNRVLARDGVKIVLVNPAGLPEWIAGGPPVATRIHRNIVGLWPNRYVELFRTGGFTNWRDYPRVCDLAEIMGLSVPSV